jgi:hypothetical protein
VTKLLLSPSSQQNHQEKGASHQFLIPKPLKKLTEAIVFFFFVTTEPQQNKTRRRLYASTKKKKNNCRRFF